MSHTPGPWGYTYDGSSDWSIGPEPDPQGDCVAGVWDRNDDRARANVSLIAAAPELLAMLRRLEFADGPYRTCCPECGNCTEHLPACPIAALISKAEGTT